MAITLLHPSRGRPEKAWKTYQKWAYQMSSHLDYILSLDSSDPELPNYKNIFRGSPFQIEVNDNRSVVEATNIAAKRSTGDILIYLSDDFSCPDGWDQLVLKEFQSVTKPMMLKVDDCLQKFNVGVLTCPIMNRHLFELLGYFYNPLYKSMHVDVDLFETTKRFIKYAPHLKFPHDHHSLGKCANDETYRRSEANWQQGLNVINERRRQGFPI